MKGDARSFLLETGGKLAADLIRVWVSRPSPRQSPPQPTPQVIKSPEYTISSPSMGAKDIDYVWECVSKHLGGASVLLREAWERANDEGMGPGTAEKIIEAMNEHAGAEPDLEKMLSVEGEPKKLAEKIISGVRQFRKAAWEAELPRGKGKKEDVEAARMWNSIMLREALDGATKYPGSECVRKGM